MIHLDSEQKRVLKAALPASIGGSLGYPFLLLVTGKLDSWTDVLIGIGIGLVFVFLFCGFYVLGSKIPKKDGESAKE